MTPSQPISAVTPAPPVDLTAVEELLPMARRLVGGDAAALIRVQARDGVLAGFAVAASGALVGRRLAASTPMQLDTTMLAGDLAAWAQDRRATGEGIVDGLASPQRRDGDWRGALPPAHGWTVLDTVPEPVVSTLVADGIAAHREAEHLGLAASAAQQLLDQSVLTVSGAPRASTGPAAGPAPVARVTNRSLSALVSMAFLPPGGSVTVAVAGRWTRIAAAFGSVWAEDARVGLSLL